MRIINYKYKKKQFKKFKHHKKMKFKKKQKILSKVIEIEYSI